MKIHRECTNESFNFLTIDTTLPVSDPLRFRKILFDPFVWFWNFVLFDNNWSDFEQKDYAKWSTKAAKISTLSFNNLGKYEHLTGEDLGLKPSTIEQTKIEHYPLGKFFNKGLDKDDQKEGLFKRLKNIENAHKNKINSKDKKDDEDKKNNNKTTI